MGSVNCFLTFIVGMLLPVATVVILYFTIFKKKVCNGDLQDCPGTGTSVCVKSGTKDWQKFCTKPPSGFGGGKQMVGVPMGPGNGLSVVDCNGCSIRDKALCTTCLDKSGQWYSDETGACQDAYGGGNVSIGTTVATNINGFNKYTCDSPGTLSY